MEGVLFLIIIPTLLFFFSKVSSIATNTLIPNQVLRHNQSLVSENQTFELGFFNPSTSNNQYYLGIWYKNIKIQTVVWVANRNNPLTDSSGFLKINNNGNLILLSRNNSIIWSSSSNHSTTKNTIAQLLDSGNFVLKYEGGNDDPESYLWQSFDYPSDTVLESMKFGFNLKTGLSQQLTSWKNQDDPSLGNFTFRIDPHGFPEYILRKGSIEQFRSGPWNGLRFSGVPETMTKVIPNPMFEFNSKEMYFVFARSNNSVILRFMLTPSGLLQALRWNERNMEWIIMITVQKDLCDSYGLCGAYGNCSMSNSPVCNCLKGFTPKSQHDWDGGEWSSGCVRRTPLYCNSNGDGDGFKKFESVKLPDTSGSWVNKSMNLKECEVKCLNNCSCTAYANSDIRGEGSGCVMWFGELVDLKNFNFGGQDLYVRMASSELDINGDPRKRKKLMIVMVSVTVVLGILICCIIWKIKTKKRGTKQKIYYTNESQKDEMELPLFDFATIAAATNNFSSDSKLGQGGFGSVYKGEVSNGQEIAVKRLSTNSRQGLNEFKNEVILIAKLQHRNLVRLLGCCIEREEKMLIYEYMANKSLDFFIFDQARSTLLSWQKRFHIIKGIAQGLLYLHRDSRLRIIHRDLKASNILLDNEMNPKISDFGMARTFGGDQTEANTNRVVGTYGYMSPEYTIDGLFSIKSDVFSFGVLVLEIVCGKKNRGFFHPDHDLNLIGHAWKVRNKGNARELIDSSMGDQLLESEVLRCIHVGLLCVQQRPEDRPTMSSVVLMLSNEGVISPKPKQPGFYNERSLTEANSVSSEKMFSPNEVSITLLGGR